MSLFPHNVIDFLKKSAYWADRSIRSELNLGYIADENDYTSNFTAEFRRQVNSKAMSGVSAISYKINGSLERKSGADACIILANENTAKLCLFEAKLPRLSTRKDAWDSIQKSTNGSHFSSQIQRQHKFINNFYIWEMFYCDEDFGKQSIPFLDYTSSCISHQDAYNFDRKRLNKSDKYSDQELINLHSYSNVLQVDEIIEQICLCNLGTPLNIEKIDDLLIQLKRAVNVLLIKGTEKS
ncbi:hypothetical protein ACO1HB_02030 [Alteromonas macleodii]|uniref:hypothetical protein n=1 Tax=Alteromonas macleodii TaxID=28108 RepID=UPI003BF9133C